MPVDTTIQNKTSAQLLNLVLDGSGYATIINCKLFTKGCVPKIISKPIQYQIILGAL